MGLLVGNVWPMLPRVQPRCQICIIATDGIAVNRNVEKNSIVPSRFAKLAIIEKTKEVRTFDYHYITPSIVDPEGKDVPDFRCAEPA